MILYNVIYHEIGLVKMKQQKHRAIYQILLERIQRFEYQSKLPSENQLSSEFGVSRSTIRMAISHLIQEGICVSSHGQGVFIIRFPQGKHFTISEVESFSETMKRNQQHYQTEIKFFQWIHITQELHELTRFPEATPVLRMLRARKIDDHTVILDENFLHPSVFAKLTEKQAEQSIYHFLEKKTDCKIALTHRIITMDYPLDFQLKIMDLGTYPMIATMHNYTYNQEGFLIEYTRAAHRPDWFIFSSVINRK